MDATARLKNVFYRVADMPRARLFYEGLLSPTVKFADGERWVQYSSGGNAFALGGASEAHPTMAGAAIVFEVKDIAWYQDRVAAVGGKVLGYRNMGSHGDTLVVSDPDGNVIHLWSRAVPANQQGEKKA
jgi:predicted enzyme related to lactoylglutathione lyase